MSKPTEEELTQMAKIASEPPYFFAESFGKLKPFGRGKLSRRIVILLAYQFKISPQMCVLRLEGLGLTKRGAWRWFVRNGGITDADIQEVLADFKIYRASDEDEIPF